MVIYPGLCRVLLLVCLFLPTSLSQTCVKNAPCMCSMSDNSGTIDLRSIGSTNGAPRWSIDDPGTPWTFSYNPCVAFTSAQFTDLAVHQQSDTNPAEEYDLGVQASETFVTDFQGAVSITYFSNDALRFSRVLLVCEPAVTDHNLEFIGELITTEYDFILTSPCACPGTCDVNGVIPPDTTTTPTTTTTSTTTTTTIAAGTQPDCNNNNDGPPSFYWEQVGADLVSLIFHDLILVVIIAIALLVMKFVFSYQLSCCSPIPKNDVCKIHSDV